jgi:hypothetical protein
MSERPSLKVVPIRDGAPLLNDVPGQLRQLADMIETGQIEPLDFVMVAARPREALMPIWWGWGEIPDRHGAAGFFMHCAQLALTDREDD